MIYAPHLIVIAIWATCVGGWIANVVKIIGLLGEPITALFIARCIGVVMAPFGVVLGFL